MVRLPDAAGQLKNAPVKVLRGFFSGIGQLLLAAERFRADEARREGVVQDDRPAGPHGEAAGQMTTADFVRTAAAPDAAAGAEPGRDRQPADPKPAGQPAPKIKGQPTSPRMFRSLDATGNVRVITPDMPAETPGENEQPPAATTPVATATTPVAAAAATTSQAAATGELPVPGYDGLSVASLRSRLRNLDASQLRILLDHERSAANRATVVTMFERRIAKLEAARDAT
jgi:hypothetical protein